jgi:xanthine dehydrogenase small subunit
VELLKDRFNDLEWIQKIKKIKNESLVLSNEHFNIILPTSIEEALLLKQVEPNLKIVAGNTDLGVVANKRNILEKNIMSLTHVDELKIIKLEKDFIEVGATVTLSELEDFVENEVVEFKSLLHIFASPQIKNQGTLVGNVLNASPIGDTIPFLLCMDAIVVIESTKNVRELLLIDFYLGYKKLDLSENELVTKIKIPRLKSNEKISLFKISMRKDLDISAVTFAGKVSLHKNKIESLSLAYGGVGPVVLRLTELEKRFIGKEFNKNTFDEIAKFVPNYICPMSDLRASREYRLLVSQNFIKKFYQDVAESL